MMGTWEPGTVARRRVAKEVWWLPWWPPPSPTSTGPPAQLENITTRWAINNSATFFLSRMSGSAWETSQRREGTTRWSRRRSNTNTAWTIRLNPKPNRYQIDATVWNGVWPWLLLLPQLSTARPMWAPLVRSSGDSLVAIGGEHFVQDSPQLCKTKKGPPMDGTACGKEKWCGSNKVLSGTLSKNWTGVLMATASQQARTLVGVTD